MECVYTNTGVKQGMRKEALKQAVTVDDPGTVTGARHGPYTETPRVDGCLETAAGWVGDFRVGAGMGGETGSWWLRGSFLGY